MCLQVKTTAQKYLRTSTCSELFQEFNFGFGHSQLFEMCYILKHLLAVLLLCLCSTFSLQDTEYCISFLSITVFWDMGSSSLVDVHQ